MPTQYFTSKQLAIFGQFLKIGYSETPDLPRLQGLFSQIISDIDFAIDLAFENRILANVVALTVETPELYRVLDDEQKSQFQLMYMENWRRSEMIKRQLLALASGLERADAPSVLMIKGGLRFFDDLYPKITHRYMADIDLYFTDGAVLEALATLGYQSDNPEEFDMLNFSQQYLDWQKTQDHHLPPIFAEDQPCHLEMHQHPVHLRAVPYCPQNLFEHSVDITDLPRVKSPSMVDQMILNLLHARYGDMYTDYSNFRLRNIFEGYLIYQRLSDADISRLGQHFSSIGKSDDIIFWKYLCLNLFDAQEFSVSYPWHIKMKYLVHARFGQSSKANAVMYSLHFMYRLVFRDVWSVQGRQTLMRKLSDKQSRQQFWKKITRIFRR
jgi:hypothetical protein